MSDLEITDKNIYLLLPGKISLIAVRYSREFKVSLIDALSFIYKSTTYRRLASEETKLWHLGPVALYDYLLDNK